MDHKVDADIILRQISEEYAQPLYELVLANKNCKLLYWCPDLKKTYESLESTILHIKDANSKRNKDGSPDFLVFFKNELAGLISLSPLSDDKKCSEIGYWLGSKFEGKGLISKSFPFILDFAQNNLKLARVELSTAVPNKRSQKLPKNFGFSEIGTICNAEELEDGVVDHTLWRLKFPT